MAKHTGLVRRKNDTAKMSPFNDAGVWKADPAVEGVGSKTAINIYAAFSIFFSPGIPNRNTQLFDEFESKHIMSASLGPCC